MKLTAQLQEHYLKLYREAVTHPERVSEVQKTVATLKPNASRYEGAAKLAADHGHHMPAWLFMLIQSMEADGDLSCNILNGQKLSRRTTIVPKGLGPFKDWEESVVAFFKDQADLIALVPDWSLSSCLFFFESYNGTGYRDYHGMDSPYLTSFTQFYTRGKYTSDGHFDPKKVSDQPGCIAILKELVTQGIVEDPIGPVLKLGTEDEAQPKAEA